MKIGFLCVAEHSIDKLVSTDYIYDLLNAVHQNTDLRYFCEVRDGTCYLKPIYSDMTYRNSFVPELEISFSRINDYTVLHMIGRPKKSIRVFMMFWFGILAMFELLLFLIAFTSGFSFPIFVPAIMCAFGYLFVKIATKLTFMRIIKTIKEVSI